MSVVVGYYESTIDTLQQTLSEKALNVNHLIFSTGREIILTSLLC